jgi:hypothetical protein
VTPGQRRLLRLSAQVVILGLVAWFVARALRGQWDEFRERSASLRPAWSLLLLSGAVVFVAYALLIDVWRRLADRGGSPVPFGRAAYVWFVSSLGKYVPGKLWAIGAMGLLAQREGVPPALAATAAILNQIVNLAAGFVVVALAGAPVVSRVWPGSRWLVVGVAGLSAIGLLLLPAVVPRAAAFVARRTGRGTEVAVRPAAVWYAVASNVIAWLLYGVAFHLLSLAIGAGRGGDWLTSTTVFTASYVLGYLALFAPGGLGMREAAMGTALTGLQLATPAEAAVLAVASRLWLTVLEVAPGALFIAHDAATRTSRSRLHDVPTRRPGPHDRP